MKRILLLLLISLLLPTWSFSQTTYPKLTNDSLIVITPQQLKQTNLIFAKYDVLKLENESLNLQVQDLKKLYNDEQIIDSLYNDHIDDLVKKNIDLSSELENKQKKVKITKNFLGASALVNIVLLTCLLL